MKIFRFFPDNKLADESLNKDMALQVLPDTAMLIQKRPFFIPDFTNCCQVQLCYAVRINRLGRSIFEQFASRYYDAAHVTLGVHFLAQDLLEELQAKHFPWDMAVGFDNAVAVSEKKVEDFSSAQQVVMKINEEAHEVSVDSGIFKTIDSQIARISRFYTLRQGDILLFPFPLHACQVQIDDRIALYLDSQELLSFNVK